MEKQEYFEKLNGIRNLFLEYLNNENGSDENYLNLTKAIEEQQVPKDKEYLKEILYLINSVSNYYYRTPHFFDMIERLIVHLKVAFIIISQILKYFKYLSKTSVFF